MHLDEVRQICREGIDWDTVNGMLIALGVSSRALCYRCSGCGNPVCWNPRLNSDTMFQFRS